MFARCVAALAVLALPLVSGCGDETALTCPGTGALALNAAQRRLADQVISVFENDTPELQYGFAEDIGDGRGITAGRAGFTSATGDMLVVVERYTDRVPGNGLAAYLPRLQQLAAAASDSTQGLEGLVAAWQAAADDPAFRDVQDEIVDEEYFVPAQDHARELGLHCPLSLLVLYDTNIQHGGGDDPDGLPAVIARTNQQAGGTPASGVEEGAWLRRFLSVRRAVLLDPANPATRDAWAESVVRVDALRSILDAGNLALSPPVTIHPYGTEHTLPVP